MPRLPKSAAPSKPDDSPSAHIHSIETCGTVDGPGLRYILFLGGCPLRCLYCHNPDAQGRPCGTEVKTASEAIADVLRYKNFIRTGGLTISGGEPLMQPAFVEATFREAKKNGIHTALDTSGFLGHLATDELLEVTDLVLLDIKSSDPETYKRVTGVELQRTLDFARRLDRLGKAVWIRYVLVPGLTDAPDNVEGVAKFVSTLSNVERIEILPFHKMGESKYEQLGIPYQLGNTPTPTAEQVQAARDLFTKHGLETH